MDKSQKEFAREVLLESPSVPCPDWLIPSSRLSPEKALSVYRNGYTARLTGALGETFESVWWVLGDEDFFKVCHRFIRAHDSATYNLSNYGKEMPAFLAKEEASQEIPFLDALATFEWNYKEVFHAFPEPGIAPEEMARALQTENIRVRFAPHCYFGAFDYAVYDIWKLRKTKCGESEIPDWKRPQAVFLFQLDGQLRVLELTPGQADLLGGLWDGHGFSESIQMAQERLESPDEVTQLFETFAEVGAVTSLESALPSHPR